jgi:hypothetical protein
VIFVIFVVFVIFVIGVVHRRHVTSHEISGATQET